MSLIIITLVSLLHCLSGTILYQEYFTNLSLRIDNSPYYVESNVIIHKHIFIENGVEIIFNNASLQVIGSINSCSNINSNYNRGLLLKPSIIFTSSGSINNHDQNPAINIRVDLGANAVFCNTKFEYISTAIAVGCNIENEEEECGTRTGSIHLYNTHFEYINNSFIFLNATNSMINNTIFNHVNNILTTKYDANINDNNIHFTNCLFQHFDNILLNYTDKSTFIDSEIIGNGIQTCLYGGNGLLSNVNISNCGCAIHMLSSISTGYDVYYSNIRNNDIGIISGSYSIVYGNNFINNIINIKHINKHDRSYKYNYWGTDKHNEIVEKILDVCDDDYNYDNINSSDSQYGLIIWWPYLAEQIITDNDMDIESNAIDVTEHAFHYCDRHILSSLYTNEANFTWKKEDSPFYIVSDIIVCDSLRINSGSTVIFTDNYLLYVFESIETCADDTKTTLFTGQNYGIPNDKTYRGSMMIDMGNGCDASICFVKFTGMQAAIIMTSNNGADSMVAISQCSFVNLKAGMTTYTGTTITNMGKAICYSNDTYSTTTSTTSTTSTSSTSTTMFPETSSSITPIHTEFTSTAIIDTTIIIKPSDSDTDTDTDTDNDCSGVDSDNDNYLILKGECSSCGKPINRKNIIKCLKRSYYNYYSSNYDVDWDLDNMVCDSLLLINIEDDDSYNKNDDGYDDNNNDNIDNNDNGNQDLNRCRNRYHMTFQLDIVFDSGGTTIDEYDKIKQPITDGNDGNNDDSNISNESEDIDMNLSSYLILCEPEFENMECDISIVESNISPYINNSSSERLFSCHILSFIFIVCIWLCPM